MTDVQCFDMAGVGQYACPLPPWGTKAAWCDRWARTSGKGGPCVEGRGGAEGGGGRCTGRLDSTAAGGTHVGVCMAMFNAEAACSLM